MLTPSSVPEPEGAPSGTHPTGVSETTQPRRTLLQVWLVLGPALTLVALVDILALWVRGAIQGGAPWGAGLFGYMLPLFLALALLLALSLTGLGGLGRLARFQDLFRLQQGTAGDALAAMGPPLGLFLILLSTLGYVTATRFNNHVLGGFLLALVGVGALLPLAMMWLLGFSLARVARSSLVGWPRLATILVWASGGGAFAVQLAWELYRNRKGIEILGIWMLLGPTLALIVALLLWLVARPEWWVRWLPVRIGLWASFPFTVLVGFTLGWVNPELPRMAKSGGMWSGVLVGIAQRLTDIDGDGSSSLFGGGDCSPFDPGIHPQARDVPGDGIDNNCIGGDSSNEAGTREPHWHSKPLGRATPRNFVVITIETLRADHVSHLGYKRKTTPKLDDFAEKSIIFPKMYAASPATVVSLAAIWTTYLPSRIKQWKKGRHMGAHASIPWVPEILKKEGFQTRAWLPSYSGFLPRSGIKYERGFDRYDTSVPVVLKPGGFRGFPSKKIVDNAISYLEKKKAGRFLLWVHLLEPHVAYEVAPGAPEFGSTPHDRYDSDIWAADREAGRLIAYLEQKKLLDTTLVLITGDHGEALGEHGFKYHFTSVYDSQVRTLGMLHIPGFGHRRIEQAVSHQDLMTTCMNIMAVKRGFATLRGRNVINALRGYKLERDEVIVEMAGFGITGTHQYGLIRWPHKLIHWQGTPKFHLFDLEKDPGELTNVAAGHPKIFKEMKERMVQHVEGIPAQK